MVAMSRIALKSAMTKVENPTRRLFAISSVAIALALLMIGCGGATERQPAAEPMPDGQAPMETDAAALNAASGRALFVANCAVCHGTGGEGQPDWHISRADGTSPAPPLNGDGHTWHHADGLLYRIVSRGGSIFETPNYPNFKSSMPAFGDRLSQEEIVATLMYVKSLWGDKTKLGMSIRESQALVSEDDPFPASAR